MNSTSGKEHTGQCRTQRATEHAQIDNRKRNRPVKRDKRSAKEEMQMANNHMNRVSQSLVIRKNES